jgi:putative phosphoesterase
MRIGILADIHGNDVALKCVLQEVHKLNIEKLLLLGDYVGYYYNVHKVLDLLQTCSNEMIKGNHELLLEQSAGDIKKLATIREKYGSGIEVALDLLTAGQIEHLVNLPEKKELILDGIRILICHGSPWNIREYIYPDTAVGIKNKCLAAEADFVFIGHSHHSFIYEHKNKVLMNVGSVGQNRKAGGIANWGFIDTTKNIFVIKETPYDVKPLIKQVKYKDPENKYLVNVLLRKLN